MTLFQSTKQLEKLTVGFHQGAVLFMERCIDGSHTLHLFGDANEPSEEQQSTLGNLAESTLAFSGDATLSLFTNLWNLQFFKDSTDSRYSTANAFGIPSAHAARASKSLTQSTKLPSSLSATAYSACLLDEFSDVLSRPFAALSTERLELTKQLGEAASDLWRKPLQHLDFCTTQAAIDRTFAQLFQLSQEFEQLTMDFSECLVLAIEGDSDALHSLQCFQDAF